MKIGFIGTGNMGGAILRGYASVNQGDTLLAYRRDTEKLNEICAETGAIAAEDVASLAAESDLFFIGVKPQHFPDILPAIREGMARAEQTPAVMSMAAGLTISQLQKDLGEDVRVMRMMPNTPALIGRGVTGICRSGNTDDQMMDKAKEICGSLGLCEEVPEELFHAVIGVSGSSPAYTYMYIGALIDAAVAEGMDPAQARRFAAGAVAGAAEMVLQREESCDTLRENVCSKGGTTIEAVKTLWEKDFEGTVKEAFASAVRRSKEMSHDS